MLFVMHKGCMDALTFYELRYWIAQPEPVNGWHLIKLSRINSEGIVLPTAHIVYVLKIRFPRTQWNTCAAVVYHELNLCPLYYRLNVPSAGTGHYSGSSTFETWLISAVLRTKIGNSRFGPMVEAALISVLRIIKALHSWHSLLKNIQINPMG